MFNYNFFDKAGLYGILANTDRETFETLVQAAVSARLKKKGPKDESKVRHNVLLWCAVHFQKLPIRRVS